MYTTNDEEDNEEEEESLDKNTFAHIQTCMHIVEILMVTHLFLFHCSRMRNVRCYYSAALPFDEDMFFSFSIYYCVPFLLCNAGILQLLLLLLLPLLLSVIHVELRTHRTCCVLALLLFALIFTIAHVLLYPYHLHTHTHLQKKNFRHTVMQTTLVICLMFVI